MRDSAASALCWRRWCAYLRTPHPHIGDYFCVFVQVHAVAGMEGALEHDCFLRAAGKLWAPVKDALELTVGDWRRRTEEKQRVVLDVCGLERPAQQTLLADAINELLGISEWVMVEGGALSLLRPVS